MLEVSSLSVGNATEDPLLSNVSFSLGQNQIMSVFGPSGSGKSTLINAIAGFIPVKINEKLTKGQDGRRGLQPIWFQNFKNSFVATGQVSINGKSIVSLEPSERPLGLVLQDQGVYPHMTVFDNIGFPLKCKGSEEEEIKTQVEEKASACGLNSELFERRLKTLSGGEKQRVAIAKMLVKEAQVGLLDEPFSHLDQLLRLDLIQLLRSLIDDRTGSSMKSALLVSHDWREIRYSDQALLVNARSDEKPIVRRLKVNQMAKTLELQTEHGDPDLDEHEAKWFDGLETSLQGA